MENVEIEVKGNVLTIEIDLSRDLGPSKSGKTTLIASSKGNVRVGDGAFMGLNVYRKA